MQSHLNNLNSIDDAEDLEIKFHCKTKVQELIRKYNDLASVDKISEANANLDEVKLQMNKNIGDMVGNGE